MNNLISIIIPVYNTEKYLAKCLDSVINQTYSNLEILLINDGSTDNSLDLCKQYADKDYRIKLIDQNNQGISVVRNTGIALAKGAYIGFVDSDDYMELNMFEILMKSMEKEKADIVCCNYKGVDEFNNQLYTSCTFDQNTAISGVEATKLIFQDKELKSFPWNKLYKKALFNDIYYPEDRIYEDVAATYQLMFKAKKVILLTDCLCNYVQRPTNITSELSSKLSYKSYYDVFLVAIEKYLFCQQHVELNNFRTKQKKDAFKLGIQTLKGSIQEGLVNFKYYRDKVIEGLLLFNSNATEKSNKKYDTCYFIIINLPLLFYFYYRTQFILKLSIKKLIK